MARYPKNNNDNKDGKDGKPAEGRKWREYTSLMRTLVGQIDRPKPKTDEELEERINEYIDYCEESGYNISYPACIAYLGLTKQEVRDIVQTGHSKTIVGGRTADILTKLGEIITAIDFIRLGDGTHRSQAGVIFEKKQPDPGGGYMDAPKIAVVTADALNVVKPNMQMLREKYKTSGLGDIIDAEPIEEETAAELPAGSSDKPTE